MQVRCSLLCCLLATSYFVSSIGSINKRELLQKDINLFKELRDKLNALEKRLDSRICNGYPLSESGVTYTRWGRTKCPKNNTELVYSGYVGGSHYRQKGAAVDDLCMPENPDKNYKYKNGPSTDRGYVYGAEFEIFAEDIGIGRSMHNSDVPCAVCRTVGSTSVLMIPGKTKIMKSWTKQYNGYLMSGHNAYEAASQYICVDKDAEKIPGTSASKNGKLLFPVEARCGSLKCPPYSDGQELACVVCSK